MAVKHARVSDEVSIAYEEVAGDPADPPVLMAYGLGAQMVAWREELLHALADRGLRVIRFDNRDAGLSTHFAGMPHLRAMLAGDTSSALYTIEDMAADTIGLIDALGLESAHLVGVSMGGMISQTVAARAPERVRSLTSIMSTTGERAASESTDEARAALFGPRATTIEEAEERAVESAQVIGTPGMIDEDWVRRRARWEFERAFDPSGYARQLAAIWASGNRTEVVRTISVPTLVLHGEVDPLIPVAGGRATAAAIDGAELVVIEGMGHDLPRPLWPRIVDAIAGHVHRAEAQRHAGEGLPAAARTRPAG
jgi:pimeloyl-ACP methyl ester carboxylesterase